MKLLKLPALLLAALMFSNTAQAHPPSHHGRSRVSIGWGASVGLGVGLALASYPYYNGYRYNYRVNSYPYDYSWRWYPSVVVEPAISYSVPVVTRTVYPTYYEPDYTYNNNDRYQASPPPQVASDREWLYCHQPDGFYPMIQSCPGGWQRVAK